MSEKKPQLVEVIAGLRSDIQAAIEEGKDKDVKFDLNEIEVELKAAITESDETKAGGKFTVKIAGLVDIGGGVDKAVKDQEEYVHTIKLKLLPKIKDPDTGEYNPIQDLSDLD